jgi:uncharacterized membrane protein YoaK (UPF0700 family)
VHGGTSTARVREVSGLLLICLTFGSGAVDAISFLGLGKVFTANMTGNFVLLGLAIAQGAGSDVIRSAVSVVAFVGGVLFASRTVSRSEQPDFWPPGVRIALGFELLAQLAFFFCWLAVSGRPGSVLEATLVGISALAMGVQSGTVARLRVAGVSTTYVTGMLTGLLSDIAGGSASRLEWMRRTSALTALIVGAACAGLLVVDARVAAPALPLACTIAVVAAAVYVLPAADIRAD